MDDLNTGILKVHYSVVSVIQMFVNHIPHCIDESEETHQTTQIRTQEGPFKWGVEHQVCILTRVQGDARLVLRRFVRLVRDVPSSEVDLANYTTHSVTVKKNNLPR